MISAADAAAQVERMSQLDYFPRSEEQSAALKELRLAVEAANSVEIAKMVIDDFIGYQSEAPKPAALRAAIWEMNEKLKPARVENANANHCGRCQGFGVIGGLAFGPARLCCAATWCDCTAGRIRMREEPDYVDRVNVAREKLLRRFGAATKPAAQTVKTDLVPVADEYHGDF